MTPHLAGTCKAVLRISACAAAVACAWMAVPAPADPDETPHFPAATAPSLNFYGVPGLIDMPSASHMPDGQFAVSVSHFAGQTRTAFSFQFSPRIAATFRYVNVQDWNSDGFGTYRDRNFDLRFLLSKETDRWPALTLGLQDFAGTGIYGSEYIVATKNFTSPFGLPGRIALTGGLGWGRYGTNGDIGSPFSDDRPAFDPGDTGGKPNNDAWFRGPVSPFAGIEWMVNDRLGLKMEYATDAYDPETSRGVFDRDSSFNFGAEYQVTNSLRLGAYYLYGSEFGVTAQLQINPKNAPAPLTVPGPRPVIVRPDRTSNPAAWSTDWAASENAPRVIRDALQPELEASNLVLVDLRVNARQAELRFEPQGYNALPRAVGRAARAMARVMPASVETFRIVPMRDGLALSAVTVNRSALEQMEFRPDASGRLLAATPIEDAEPRLPGAIRNEDAFPRFGWSLGPYVSPSYFDPDRPVRADAGVSAEFRYRFAPGWKIAGEVRHRLVGNVEDGDPGPSTSDLHRVRSDGALYAAEGETSLENLYLTHQWKPDDDLYARITTGYLESMYGGVSAELLWKPVTSRLALGVEANYAKQRDFDQDFGFQDYDVFTGHVSAYYDVGGGYTGQVDVGRYLAGDNGATFTVSREFSNGWKVGGFFTLTDVSSAEFGEGSFDKGITVEIPVEWFLGRSSQRKIATTVRPVQRDGGARLNVPGRLYGQIRDTHREALTETWPQVWE